MKKQDYGTVKKQDYEAKPDLAFGVSMEGKVRILQWVRLNLETKCCGEVIGDDVQLWTETGDLSETKWLGKNMTWNITIFKT